MNGMRSDLQSLDVMHHGKITPEEAADKDATTNPFTKEEENHRDDNDNDTLSVILRPKAEESLANTSPCHSEAEGRRISRECEK